MTTPGYYPDLSTFSILKLKTHLKTARMLPSQKILQENIDEHFACIEQRGIGNLEQLQRALKTKSDVLSFSKATGLSLEYLTLLRREVNSNQPKPIDLKDFPGVNPQVIHNLRQLGIKDTEQLFPHVLTPQARSVFAQQNQIADEDILDLTKLTDVARTKWVGPKFARLLVESGYDTVAKIANADGDKLHRALIRANDEHGIYKGKFGLEDIGQWVKTVQDVPQIIQY
jgi:hypothetical protein